MTLKIEDGSVEINSAKWLRPGECVSLFLLCNGWPGTACALVVGAVEELVDVRSQDWKKVESVCVCATKMLGLMAG